MSGGKSLGTRRLSSGATAAALSERGYWPLPVVKGSKAVSIRDWTELRIRPVDVKGYWPEGSELGVGMLLGVESSPGVYPIAIDIDLEDQELIERIGLAFSFVPPGKMGSKGITYFVRTPEPIKKRLIKRKDPITNAQINTVEVLAAGQQTVMPPSVHPKGMEYTWVGTPLYDLDAADLPELTATVMKEIEVAVHKPLSSLFGLNDMVSGGEQGGGTIHNSVLSAVAVLVALQWSDDEIWNRVWRATQRAVSSLDELPRDYEQDRWEPVVRRMIEDARAKGFDQVKAEKIHKVAARWVLNDWKGSGNTKEKGSQLTAYQDGWWRTYSDKEVRKVIATSFPEPQKASLLSSDWKSIVDTAIDMAPELPEKPGNHKVCLLNGTVDMDTGEMTPWSPDDNLISQLPFDYDPDAKCPTYEKVLLRAFAPVNPEAHPDDLELSINCYEEFVAHTLFECLDYHRFLVIKGKPRSGKSTLFKVARMLHGKHAVSGVPVQEFGNERYRTAMVGKLLNVVNEVAAMSHASDDFLKSITAGDEVEVRFLYRETQLVQLPARIMIACNEMFRIRDTSGAIEERMLILACDNVLKEEDRDVKMPQKLKQELPGIFNRMVVAWRRLSERGRFLPPEGMKDELEQFTTENNVVLAWMKDRTWQGAIMEGATVDEAKLKVTDTGTLYTDFAQWADANGHKQCSKITFGMKLTQIQFRGHCLDSQLIWVGGKPVRVRNVTLVDGGKF